VFITQLYFEKHLKGAGRSAWLYRSVFLQPEVKLILQVACDRDAELKRTLIRPLHNSRLTCVLRLEK